MSNEFADVRRNPGSSVVRVVRSDRPTFGMVDIERAWGTVNRALAMLERSEHALLLDLRQAPGRTDDAYERAIVRYRRETVKGFARVAVLVASLPGEQQVRRHIAADGFETVQLFASEEEAIDWLRESPFGSYPFGGSKIA